MTDGADLSPARLLYDLIAEADSDAGPRASDHADEADPLLDAIGGEASRSMPARDSELRTPEHVASLLDLWFRLSGWVLATEARPDDDPPGAVSPATKRTLDFAKAPPTRVDVVEAEDLRWFHWPEERDELAAWIALRPWNRVRLSCEALTADERAYGAWRVRRWKALPRADGSLRLRTEWVVLIRSKSNGYRADDDLFIRRASDIVRRRPRWVWRQRIPQGMVTLLDGDPGLGKSTLTVDLAARVSRGAPFPDGAEGFGPHDVIIMSAEDDAETTIQPRLEAAGADTSRVHIFEGLRDTNGNPVPVSVPEDIDALRRALRSTGARLLIIDPFVAYLDSDIDSHRDQAVRRAMSALKSLAEHEQAGILLVRHLTKGSGGSKALYRGGGSIGLIAHARAAMMVTPHPEQPGVVVLAQSKLNIGEKGPSLGMRVVPWETDPAWGRIEWGAAVDLTADDLLHASDHGPTKRNEAEVWLLEVLTAGAMRSEQLQEGALDEGFSEATLRRARTVLRDAGLIDRRKVAGDDPHWEWFSLEGGVK